MPTTSDRAQRLFASLVLLAGWQLAAAWIDDAILPTPWTVAETLVDKLASGEMAEHLGATLARVLAAFVVAMGVGSAIGIVMGRSRRINAALDTLLLLGLNLPALVVIMLCYVWFGLTEAAAILAVSINKIPNTAVTLREGARAVDDELLQVARAFRLGRAKTLWRVFLPQLYPYLMAAARSGLALVWKIVLVVELLGRSNGVGFMLGSYFQFFDVAAILAYSLAFAAIILLLEWLLMERLDRRLARWR